jgi:hypothetical protein
VGIWAVTAVTRAVPVAAGDPPPSAFSAGHRRRPPPPPARALAPKRRTLYSVASAGCPGAPAIAAARDLGLLARRAKEAC